MEHAYDKALIEHIWQCYDYLAQQQNSVQERKV